MSTGWSAYDEGYLQAYGWAGSLAAGASLPVEQPPIALGPGEVAHAHLSPVNVLGYFGEDAQYRRSFLLFGGPVGLAVTGAASLAYNASKKAEAERKATPSWHRLGGADLVMTSQRLALTLKGQIESFWYAETGPLQATAGAGGVPAVQAPAVRDAAAADRVRVGAGAVRAGAPPARGPPAGSPAASGPARPGASPGQAGRLDPAQESGGRRRRGS